MAAKKGLGTGLDVLFGESAKDEEQKELVQSLPIAKVEPREGQPRTVFDEEALGELSESSSGSSGSSVSSPSLPAMRIGRVGTAAKVGLYLSRKFCRSSRLSVLKTCSNFPPGMI